MLIKITEKNFLNSDYIVALNFTKLPPKTSEDKAKFAIVARMIDNSALVLLENEDDKVLYQEYDRLIHAANKIK